MGSSASDFTSLFRQHFADVRRWVAFMSRDHHEADDLAQRVFEVVLARLPDFDGRNVRGWLYAICRLTVAGHRRRIRTRERLLLPAALTMQLAQAPEDPDRAYLRRRQAAAMLARLPDKLRTAVLLHEGEGCSAEEIARQEGVLRGTVYSRLRRARERLDALRREEEEAR